MDQFYLLSKMFSKNRLIIFPSIVLGNRIKYTYKADGPCGRFFTNNIFEIEYPFGLETIPESIRIIPFLAQIIPVAWICDAEIIIPVCDKDFLDCIESIKKGYQEMYPTIVFGGKIIAKRVEVNSQTERKEKTMVCFSGGVDSICTTLTHLQEDPLLVSLWGADVPYDDENGWKPIEKNIHENAEILGLKSITVRTSFRDLLNAYQLSFAVKGSKDDWWHGFQHGLGILGHMAPVVWKYKIQRVYIASSNTVGEKYTCASDPTIDNYVRYCGTSVSHDGYEIDRQTKVGIILDYCHRINRFLKLHVCWEKHGEDNCCHCEKCWRTMLAIIAESCDPRKYGFSDYFGLESFSDDIENDFQRFSIRVVQNYLPIQNRLHKVFLPEKCPQKIRWFYDADLKSIQNGIQVLHNGCLLKRAWLLGTPDHSNVGDQCIAESELGYLNSKFPSLYIIEINKRELITEQYRQLDGILPIQPVFLHGGGNLGSLWQEEEYVRETIIERLKESKITIFPQSIYFSDDTDGQKMLEKAKAVYSGKNILLCCRDKVSFSFAEKNFSCRSVLTPDMVLWKKQKCVYSYDRFGAMTIFRGDKETRLNDAERMTIEDIFCQKFKSLDQVDMAPLLELSITKSNRQKIITNLIERISSVQCVVTDRLHGMILCAVTGTPCIVFSNNYHKITSCYEWIKDLDYIFLLDKIEDLESSIQRVLSAGRCEYPEKHMEKFFNSMAEEIESLFGNQLLI